MYCLFRIINHEGNLLDGHYYSFIKIKDDWYKLNDIIITNETNL